MRQPRRAFSLVELLTVIAVIGILAAILIPTLSGIRESARVTKSTANLRHIGAGVLSYVADNKGFLPGGRTPEGSGVYSNRVAEREGRYAQWTEEIMPYVEAGMDEPSLAEVSDVFRDPVYESIAGPIARPAENYRGGYSWNARLGLTVGDTFGPFHLKSSRMSRTRVNALSSDAILVGPYYWESFHPRNDGTVPESRFSVTKTFEVDHQRRIGADAQGEGGDSALYLFLDGSVRQLTPGSPDSDDPDTAAYYLKLREN